MTGQEQAQIHVERHSELANNLQSADFLVDGRRRGSVGTNGVKTFRVPPGPRFLLLRLGETETNTIPLTLTPGEDVVLQCGSPPRMPNDIGAVLRGQGATWMLWPAFDLALAHLSLGYMLLEDAYERPWRSVDPELAPALTAFEEAARRRPEDPLAHHYVGQVRCRLGRHAEAIPALERALEAQPDHAPSHLYLGLARAEDPARALASLERATELDDAYGRAYFEQARLLAKSGERERAIQALDRAVGRRGVPREAIALRKRLHAELGRPDPEDSGFGRLFLEAYRKAANGYGGLPFEEIQALKRLDREGFLTHVAKLPGKPLKDAELQKLQLASPQEVAVAFHDAILRMQGQQTKGALWWGILSSMGGWF